MIANHKDLVIESALEAGMHPHEDDKGDVRLSFRTPQQAEKFCQSIQENGRNLVQDPYPDLSL